MFKNPGGEQNNEEMNTIEPCENIEENYEEENQSEELNTQEACENTESNYLSMLEALDGEEKSLLAEKSQLLNMEETLRQKIIDEIEAKKHRIEILKNEIPELKQRCEFLAKLLDIPVQR
jgi:hypothetical protein